MCLGGAWTGVLALVISQNLNIVRARISTLPDFITALLSWPVVPAKAGVQCLSSTNIGTAKSLRSCQSSIPFTAYRQSVYTFQMIESFRSKDTQALFEGKRVKRFANMEAIAQRKLQQLDSASTLEFLRSPPGNRLEALAGDRAGQHSIRSNDQLRLCFVWNNGNATDVEIVDYHGQTEKAPP